MRLTVLCICGTLLGFLNLSQMKEDEGELLRERAIEPCTATLTPGTACRPGEHDRTCPYLFSLPPLTVHLPLQLGELEKIMQDLQKLKDSVDEVREMCAECTVSQSGRECEKQKEKLNEGKETHNDGRKRMNLIPEENNRNSQLKCEKDIRSEKTFQDEIGEEWLTPDENTETKLEADEQSLKKVIKEHEKEGTRAENTEKREEIKTESERKKNPQKQMEKTTTGANVFNTRETVDEKNKRSKELNSSRKGEMDNLNNYQEERLDGVEGKTATTRNEQKDGKYPQMWSSETKKNDSNSPPKDDDKIKISTNQEEYKEKELKQRIPEKKEEIEEGTNNEKQKQTESAGNTEKERNKKQGERDKLEKEAEKGNKWKDNDGKASSNTASEKAVFVSISPTSHSTIRISSRSDLLDSIRAKIFTSSLPFPSSPSSTLSSITAVSRDTEAVYGPTERTDAGAAGFLWPENPDKEFATSTTKIIPVGDLTQSKSGAAPWSVSPSIVEVGANLQYPTSTTPTTTPHQKLDATSLPRATNNLRNPQKNISSSIKTVKKPPPSKAPKPDEKPKHGIKLEAENKQKKSKDDQKPGQIPSAKNTKYTPKQKPSPHKPKPDKGSKQTQISIPGRQIPADVSIDPNLKKNSTDEHSEDSNSGQTKLPVQKPKRKSVTSSYKLSFPTPRPQTENTTHPEKYHFSTKRGDNVSDLNAKPTKKLETRKPEPEKKSQSEENDQFDEKTKPSQNSTSVYSKRSQMTTFTTKPNQHLTKPVGGDGQKKPSDSIPEKTFNPDQINIQKPTLNISKTNQKPVKKPDSEQRKTVTADRPPDEKNKLETTLSTDESFESTKEIPKIIEGSYSIQEPKSDKSESATPTQLLIETEENIQHEPKSTLDSTSGEKNKYEGSILPSAQEPELKPEDSNINGKDPDAERGQTDNLKADQNHSEKNDTNKHVSHLLFSSGQDITSTTTTAPLRPESNKNTSKMNQVPQPNQKLDSEQRETATIKPHRHQTELGKEFNKSLAHEFKPFSPSTPKETIISDQTNPSLHQVTVSDRKVPEAEPGQKPESERSEMFTPKPTQKPLTKSYREVAKNDSLSNQDSVGGHNPELGQDNSQSDKKTKLSGHIPKTIQKPKPGQNPNQKRPKASEIQKTKPNLDPKTKQVLKNKTSSTSPRPHQKPNLKATSNPNRPRKVVPDRTLMPKPTSRAPSRPVFKPGQKFVQKPKLASQPKKNQKTKSDSDPPLILWTTSNSRQNSQTGMPPTSGLVKSIAEVTHPPGEPEFSVSMGKFNTLSPNTYNSLETGSNSQRIQEDSTLSPNSWIVSDLKPQTTRQSSMTQSTARQNNIHLAILPNVITSTIPGTPHPSLVSKSRIPANILHNVEETRPATSLSSPSSVTTSTPQPDFGSASTTTSDPETFPADLSSPSSQELRVKIKQVSALLNNSLSPNGTPTDRLSKEQPRSTMGGNKPGAAGSEPLTSAASEVRRDCADLLLRGESKSGVYSVTPDLRSSSFLVFCDMSRDGGGWTVLQRRQDGSVSFNRTWLEYQSGFGELDGEFWLGNNFIHLLTRDRDMVLRVELEDFEGVKGHAQYEHFRVAGERQRYRLTVGRYSGTAGDALHFNKMYDHNNKPFSTPDKDHDRYPSGNCGAYYSSGWWFDACMAANLNGRYYQGKYKGVRDGIFWGTWHNISKEYYPTNERQSFKTVRMMIKPKGFVP